VKEFTANPQEIKNFLKEVKAIYGKDPPENVCGGLEKALNLDWQSANKIAFFIADYPCHGSKY
jgi:hypothetical protein